MPTYESDDPNSIALKVKMAAGQVADGMQITTSADDEIFSIAPDGTISFVFPGEPAVGYIQATYIISKVGSTYYATACRTGGTNYTGANFVTLINQVFAAITDGGTIFFRNGTYICDGSDPVLQSKDYVHLIGESWGVIFYRANSQALPATPTTNGFTSTLLRLNDCDYCTIENIQFSGNYTNQLYCNDGTHPSETEANGGMPADWTTDQTGENAYDGIFLTSCQYCRIEHVWSHDNGTNNIRIGSTKRGTATTASDYNTVIGCMVGEGRNGILGYGDLTSPKQHGNHLSIIGNQCYGGHGYAGIYLYGDYQLVNGNICEDYSGAGYPVGRYDSDGMRFCGSVGSVIADNICHDNSEHGIALVSSGATNCTFASVTGNLCSSNGYYGICVKGDGHSITGNVCTANTAVGILTNTCSKTIIADNNVSGSSSGISNTTCPDLVIAGNMVFSNTGYGIVSQDCFRQTIKGNIVFDNVTAGMYVLEVVNSCTDCHITGNSIYDTAVGAARTQLYALKFYAVHSYTGIVVESNFISNNKTGVVTGSLASNVYYHNQGYATENTVLSGTFAIDSTGVKTVAITHGLAITPNTYDCVLTVVEDTAVDDWNYDLLKVTATSSTTVTAKINVSHASETGSATAKLALSVRK